MTYREPAHPSVPGITVYGCEPDEADLFSALSPRFGLTPTLTNDTPSETGVITGPAHRCVSVGHKSAISAPLLRSMSEAGVEYLCTRSIGVDHIDLRAAHGLGITVDNVVYPPDGVADFTLMLMLMAVRHATEIISATDVHDYRLGMVRGRDLVDMTVGVVGVGHIGAAVVSRLRGFGCRVLAYDKSPNARAAADHVALDALLAASDIVTLHLPLNAETSHLIGRRQIASMKRGAVVVNTSRGALIDTDALVGALEGGHLGGAALDVVEGEKGIFSFDRRETPIDHHLLLRLHRLPNVIVTPHTAHYTRRTLHHTVETTLRKCLTFERTRANGTAQDRNLVRGPLGGTRRLCEVGDGNRPSR